MKNGKNYKVILLNDKGEEVRDNKVFKTLDGALSRLSALVMSEELCINAGFGRQHEYHIIAC